MFWLLFCISPRLQVPQAPSLATPSGVSTPGVRLLPPSMSTLSLATDPHTWGASLCPAHRGVHRHAQAEIVLSVPPGCVWGSCSLSLAGLTPLARPHWALAPGLTSPSTDLACPKVPTTRVAPSRHPALPHTPVLLLLLTAPRGFFTLLKQTRKQFSFFSCGLNIRLIFAV